MVELDDPVWSRLAHAYGNASDVPDLLRRLARDTKPKNGYESEPWFTLWSSLCHQGDVFDASYAAVPHIVTIALRAPWPLDFNFFQLPAAIEISRTGGRGPEISQELSTAYFDAIRRLGDAVVSRVGEEWDQSMLLSAVCALSVSKGNNRVAEAIQNLDDDIIAMVIDLDFGELA